MSDTIQKTLAMVANAAIEASIMVVNWTETVEPADSHAQLKAAIVANLNELRIDVKDEPVKLPQ